MSESGGKSMVHGLYNLNDNKNKHHDNSIFSIENVYKITMFVI